ncbi:hypothetical protein HanXRQr2_Chr17g0806901 [Helianthus annuus]|uniref:Uncharacterized protein n=1 Tax=Helianthus annuus TaxID=4232 RepID=A0A9K3DKF1_HELAN|nr:hypothetical protein HanXRQr2_Chr17g0806901 [Helianthus annuus]
MTEVSPFLASFWTLLVGLGSHCFLVRLGSNYSYIKIQKDKVKEARKKFWAHIIVTKVCKH